MRLTSCSGLPSIMLFQEEADNIVVETLLDKSDSSEHIDEDIKEIVAAGKKIKECIQKEKQEK